MTFKIEKRGLRKTQSIWIFPFNSETHISVLFSFCHQYKQLISLRKSGIVDYLPDETGTGIKLPLKSRALCMIVLNRVP